MQINREKAKAVFMAYTAQYDSENEKVRLKIEHTCRVSELCAVIAESLQLSKEDREFAWLIGLLHDIGRFEQLKKYGTFIDAESIDHARYGAFILFKEGKIRDYVTDESEDKLLWAAVYFHNAFKLPENPGKEADGFFSGEVLDSKAGGGAGAAPGGRTPGSGILDENREERYRMFCNIIRDADKIDILRANVEFSLEEIYNVSTKELKNAVVSPEVMEAFDEGHAVLRGQKQTAADNIVGLIAFAYELVFPVSRRLIKEQGYLNRIMDFESENPLTRKQFRHIREKMNAFLAT